MKDLIDSDFAEILGDGLSGTLEFPAASAAGTAQSVPAMISEITFSGELAAGGVRPRRAFTATARRAAFAEPDAPPPKPGGLVRYAGETFRVTAVRTRPESPLVEIEFSEK